MNAKMKLVAGNMGSDLNSLPECEAAYKEGDRGEVRLYFDQVIDDSTIKQMESELLSQGVILTENIRQDAGIIAVRFRKGLAPLAILAIVVGGIVALGGLLVGWQVFRLKYMGVPTWVIVLGAAAAIYLILTSGPAKATGRAAVGAGKWAGERYIERKTGGSWTTPPDHQLPLGISGGG